MTGEGERLRGLTAEIVASSGGPELQRLVMQLSLLLRKAAEGVAAYAERKGRQETTVLESGVALGAWAAAGCAEDQQRTACFLKGAVRVIERLLEASPGRRVHLLEAGCGPLATLAAPLAARFGPGNLQLTLVDIHPESVGCAERVLAELGLADCLGRAVCADVTDCELDGSVDVILTETMWAALFREPQVAITRHLLRRFPEAALVPEEIRVDLVLLDPAGETSGMPPVVKEREVLGEVYRLDRESAMRPEDPPGYLPARAVAVPDHPAPGRGLFLVTTVTVAEGVSFADYDSQVTIPIPLGGPAIHPGDRLVFRYRLGSDPGLECEPA